MKIKYKNLVIIASMAILGILIAVLTVNNSDGNLNTNMISVSSITKDGQRAVVLGFEYKWAKMPIRLLQDKLKIHWSEGWQIYDFSIKINDIDETRNFYNPVDMYRNEFEFLIGSNESFLSEECCTVLITLIPKNNNGLNLNDYSTAGLEYTHNKILGNIKKTSSVAWQNKTMLGK